jgi:hypothetical protein
VEFSLDLKTEDPKQNGNMLYIAHYQASEYLKLLQLPSTDMTAIFYNSLLKAGLYIWNR